MIRNKAHLRFIESLPCCATGRTGCQAHHLLRVEGKCMGRRSGDNWAIPLHHEVHAALHADGNEERFLAKYGIDGPALAAALWRVSGDEDAAWAILMEVL